MKKATLNSTHPLELYDYIPEELPSVLDEAGIRGFKVREVAKWLYEKKVSQFEEMTTLSKDERKTLTDRFSLVSFEVQSSHLSPDGTRKILYRLRDGRFVESVLIPEGKRLTLCVSTQVGCPVGCNFCASGLDGLRRNLSTAEIVGQFVESARQSERPITNVVIMGMGEPFLNYDAVMNALQIFHHQKGLNLGRKRITLSTVALDGFIEKIFSAPFFPRLAISLHAPTDEIRREIIPFPRILGVAKIADFIRRYTDRSRDRVTIEYVMLAEVNSSRREAHILGKLLGNLNVKVNLIPHNAVEGIDHRAPTSQEVDEFAAIVSGYGMTVTVRKRNGDHINAACGQLRLVETKKN